MGDATDLTETFKKVPTYVATFFVGLGFLNSIANAELNPPDISQNSLPGQHEIIKNDKVIPVKNESDLENAKEKSRNGSVVHILYNFGDPVSEVFAEKITNEILGQGTVLYEIDFTTENTDQSLQPLLGESIVKVYSNGKRIDSLTAEQAGILKPLPGGDEVRYVYTSKMGADRKIKTFIARHHETPIEEIVAKAAKENPDISFISTPQDLNDLKERTYGDEKAVTLTYQPNSYESAQQAKQTLAAFQRFSKNEKTDIKLYILDMDKLSLTSQSMEDRWKLWGYPGISLIDKGVIVQKIPGYTDNLGIKLTRLLKTLNEGRSFVGKDGRNKYTFSQAINDNIGEVIDMEDDPEFKSSIAGAMHNALWKAGNDAVIMVLTDDQNRDTWFKAFEKAFPEGNYPVKLIIGNLNNTRDPARHKLPDKGGPYFAFLTNAQKFLESDHPVISLERLGGLGGNVWKDDPYFIANILGNFRHYLEGGNKVEKPILVAGLHH